MSYLLDIKAGTLFIPIIGLTLDTYSAAGKDEIIITPIIAAIIASFFLSLAKFK